jgi:superoxide dismutase, Fe-Mn family
MFTLPELPYSINALEPFISAKTIEFHHGRHHMAYVNNLNKMVVGTEFENATLEDIIKKADGGIFNNGAQVWNHTFYWHSLTPNAKELTHPELMQAINKKFGSIDKFKEEFTNACITLFGSGWAWLVKNTYGELDIVKENNAGNPLRTGLTPLLTCDVWEHAYYLDYQNRRPDYVNEFWKFVNWEVVAKRFEF